MTGPKSLGLKEVERGLRCKVGAPVGKGGEGLVTDVEEGASMGGVEAQPVPQWPFLPSVLRF